MKVGDKVVCIWNGGFEDIVTGEVKPFDPKFLDVLTIDGFLDDYICFKEIPQLDSSGQREYYIKECFRKIEPRTNALSSKLATEFIEQDKKVKEQELEKVFTLTAKF